MVSCFQHVRRLDTVEMPGHCRRKKLPLKVTVPRSSYNVSHLVNERDVDFGEETLGRKYYIPMN